MQIFALTIRNGSTLPKILFSFLFVAILLAIHVEISRADSPPNLTQDIPWTDIGGVFDISDPNPDNYILDATFNGVEDIRAAFNNGRREEEKQLGLEAGSLGTLDLPSQAEWDTFSDDQKALWIINEERIDRAGMLSDIIGLPLEGLEINIDNIAQGYAELLVSGNGFGHYYGRTENGQIVEDQSRFGPSKRIDADPVIGVDAVNGDCHEFLMYSENLAAFWGLTQTPLYIERAFYNWIYADAISAWGHREAALVQDVALGQTDLRTGFGDNVGSIGSEGWMGIGVVHSAEYNPFGIDAEGIGTIVVQNFFDPVPEVTRCPWVTVTPTPTPSDTPVPTNTSVSVTDTPVPTDTLAPAPTNTPLTPVGIPAPATVVPVTPTNTSIPPTDTPASTPIDTPTATDTPVPPTDTPEPTANPELDTDQDGIPDSVECSEALDNLDMDGDGLDNCNDFDSDGDGLSDLIESQPSRILGSRSVSMPVDSDSDGDPDYRDKDSDDDGLSDTIEAFDHNGDGQSDVTASGDADKDGIDDAYGAGDVIILAQDANKNGIVVRLDPDEQPLAPTALKEMAEPSLRSSLYLPIIVR